MVSLIIIFSVVSFLLISSLSQSFAEELFFNQTQLVEIIEQKWVDDKLTLQKRMVAITVQPIDYDKTFKEKTIGHVLSPTDIASVPVNVYPQIQQEIDSGAEVLDVVIAMKEQPSKLKKGETMVPKEQREQRTEEKATQILELQKDIVQFIEENGGIVVTQFKNINGLSATIPSTLVEKIKERQDILSVTPRFISGALAASDSRSITGIEDFWDQSANCCDGFGTKIGIIDSGIDNDHADLNDLDNDSNTNQNNKILEFRDMTNFNDPSDCVNHGTSVAGIATGTGQILPTLKGFSPQSNILSYKVTEDCFPNPMIDDVAIINSFNEASNDDADVINLSISAPFFNKGDNPISLSANAAYDDGIAVVASVGNVNVTNPSSVGAPASAKKVIAVGSVLENNVLWDDTPQGGFTCSRSYF